MSTQLEVGQLGPIAGVLVARPVVHQDRRGSFLEMFREDALGARFVQGNHSHSRAGVLRGLHYHARQADAWYVVSGRARVGLADLRTRAERPAVAAIELSGDDPAVLYIPPGVAHGFHAITDVDLIYLVTEYFDGSDEHDLAWNDPALDVPWEVADPVLSDRDATAAPLDWDRIETNLS